MDILVIQPISIVKDPGLIALCEFVTCTLNKNEALDRLAIRNSWSLFVVAIRGNILLAPCTTKSLGFDFEQGFAARNLANGLTYFEVRAVYLRVTLYTADCSKSVRRQLNAR